MNEIKFFLKKIRSLYYYLLYSIIDYFLKREGYVYKNSRMKSLFYLPYVRTDIIQKKIVVGRKYYEQENLDFICKNWNNGIIGAKIKDYAVLDIGANIGNHTLYFLNECDACFVHCFEPIEDTFNILNNNIKLNQLENRTRLYNMAIGRDVGNALVTRYNRSNIGATTLTMSEKGEIKVINIDSIKFGEKIGLVKIDVEGFEIEVLYGMLETLRKQMPYMMIEILDVHFAEASSLLKELGYQYKILDEKHGLKDCLFYK